jgi:hypothetical protein
VDNNMSGGGGFLFRFISKVGGPRAQSALQKYIDGRELQQAREQAWDFAEKNYTQAMKSNDKEFVKKTLEAAKLGGGSTFGSLLGQHVTLGNLSTRLSELEKISSKPPKPDL